ncbi:MAG: heme ABC exporter ATP-binding protein CcmA [Geminicoccaceae bacterium]
MSETALFEGRDLAALRGGRLVFEGLSFALAAGDALVLRGPNGSGKSTLLRMLAGFLRSEHGQMLWQGEPIGHSTPEHRSRLHFVGHADAVKPLLTVEENVAFAAALDGAGRAGLDAALDHFGLRSLAATVGRLLSSGQKRRTALARLVAAPRPLWLLDEPGVGLDKASRARLESVIADHRRGGGTVVVATHGDVAIPDPLVLDFDG